MSIRKSRDGWFAPLDWIGDASDVVASYLRDTDNPRTLDPSDVPGSAEETSSSTRSSLRD